MEGRVTGGASMISTSPRFCSPPPAPSTSNLKYFLGLVVNIFDGSCCCSRVVGAADPGHEEGLEADGAAENVEVDEEQRAVLQVADW